MFVSWRLSIVSQISRSSVELQLILRPSLTKFHTFSAFIRSGHFHFIDNSTVLDSIIL